MEETYLDLNEVRMKTSGMDGYMRGDSLMKVEKWDKWSCKKLRRSNHTMAAPAKLDWFSFFFFLFSAKQSILGHQGQLPEARETFENWLFWENKMPSKTLYCNLLFCYWQFCFECICCSNLVKLVFLVRDFNVLLTAFHTPTSGLEN